jgi:molybdopterin-binding protein
MSTRSTQTESPTPPTPELGLAEHVCLALIADRDTYGWAIVKLLAPEGDIGRVWTLSRALTYRAIDGLVTKGMVTRETDATHPKNDRTTLTATPAGRDANRAWLDRPVEHLRDVRTEFLVKITLRTRFDMDNAPLLAAQQEAFAPTIDALTTGSDHDLIDVWRRENARAVKRFLDLALRPTPPSPTRRSEIRLSARNQLRGTVIAVQRGELMANVKAVLGDGQQLTATITQEASDDLDIAAGDDVIMIIKASEVMVAKTAAE